MFESSNTEPKCVKIRYDFVARNSNELTVQKGEVLEVLNSEKQWWLVRNRSTHTGYVPCNVLEELKAGETQYNRAEFFNSQAVNPYKATSPPALINHTENVEMNKSSRDKDNRTQQKEVNDELLKRITDSKAQPPARNFRVEHPIRTLPITYDSQPFEICGWLNAKGFSRPVVDSLGILTGAQLFSLSKDELKAVCGDEGSRVYSQISVQKAQIERSYGNSELEEIMKRRQREVDAFTWN
ncbi:epidermal growth factor receptor kinase substrate 8-like protein 2 isoform X1 [Ictalurus punctatus]|uniref:Epidermal growth factor receptor kinase substrate 8-like protein 2 isoform X1 n=1 Tax=Ictalurus punctatus TaxID=7998 RepID=A0A979ESR6_ICTPU|nr:epidermal growth factor receptor kinase substrate 8-like protein 2 isoform X1 [Ictalurus punctatus]